MAHSPSKNLPAKTTDILIGNTDPSLLFITRASATCTRTIMADDADDLRASEQTVTSLQDPAYWLACCPWLSCSRDSSAEREGSSETYSSSTAEVSWSESEEAEASTLRASLQERGFCSIPAGSSASLAQRAPGLNSDLVSRLNRGVLRLVELGHTASAINSYDEAWELAEYITPLLRKATGNAPLGDWFSFHVTAARPSGFVGPHRDKPMAAAETFREDGSPMYATVWVALSDATPESSCLYFIPKGDDPGAQGGKVTAVVLNVPQRWRVTALTAARLRTPARLHAYAPTKRPRPRCRLLRARGPAARRGAPQPAVLAEHRGAARARRLRPVLLPSRGALGVQGRSKWSVDVGG